VNPSVEVQMAAGDAVNLLNCPVGSDSGACGMKFRCVLIFTSCEFSPHFDTVNELFTASGIEGFTSMLNEM
jgi:hypothetical protein